jgi:RNA polymerase sigma-70 factor (ECF subfamily)
MTDDQGFLDDLRAGDPAAYERLVQEQGPRMLAVATRFLRNDEDARDAVQDAFVSAFRSLPSFEAGSQLSTWLHRIVVNASLMRLRSRRRKPEEPLDGLLPSFFEDGHRRDPAPPWQETAETALQRREVRELVRGTIDELPETYRAALLLRDIEGFDTEQAARLLGVTPNAVKVRLHRARQALRTLLEPYMTGGDR